jgi:hypothetical protein
MAGSSIAAPGAVAWVTDFLNAAYYARAEAERDVTELRLANGIITTRWALRGGGRLGAVDVIALNHAYGALRLRRGGRLDRDALLDGARTLLGTWFAQAWEDPERRAHGIAFAAPALCDAFLPERRIERAALGPMTPPLREPRDQHWATYDPVLLPAPEAALAFLSRPARWPDMGAATGRFTALRGGGLPGQTFEIEVVAEPAPRSPVFTRGYVTCTTFLVATETPDALESAVADLGARYVAGAGSAAAVTDVLPAGATPLALVVLTTHEGHFLGRGLSHLLVWRDRDGTAWIRDVGAWDPLPLHLAATYATAGRTAQHAFWGPTPSSRSMLAQLALVSAAA